MKMLRCAMMHFKRMIKSPNILIGCITVPILVVTIVVLFTRGQTGSDSISVNVVNNDSGTFGKMLISQLKSSSSMSVTEASMDDAQDRIKTNRSDAAIVIPEDFTSKLQNASKPEVKLYKLQETMTDMAVVNNINSFISKKMLEGSAIKASGSKELAKSISEENGDKQIKTNISVASKDNSTPLSNMLAMNFSIIFLMFTMIYIVNELITLKNAKILRRCLSTPHSTISIAASLVTAFMLIGWLEAAIMVGIPTLFFNISFGHSYLALFLTYTALIIVIMSMGVFLCRFVKDIQSSALITNIVLQITCMLSGCYVPLQYMPPFMRKIALFIPQNWALTALTDIAVKNKGLIDVLPNIGILFLFALAFLTASTSSIKKFVES